MLFFIWMICISLSVLLAYCNKATLHFQYVQVRFLRQVCSVTPVSSLKYKSLCLLLKVYVNVLLLSLILFVLCWPCRAAIHNVKVKPKAAVLNMLKRLDKIRFRGPKRDDFLDLPESPTGSDTECSDDMLLRPRPSLRDNDEQRDPVSNYTHSHYRV